MESWSLTIVKARKASNDSGAQIGIPQGDRFRQIGQSNLDVLVPYLYYCPGRMQCITQIPVNVLIHGCRARPSRKSGFGAQRYSVIWKTHSVFHFPSGG
jgi:hypothetical protein